jgi:hypothetical protein
VVTYRETLRLLLQLEPIESALRDLSNDTRMILCWSYVDQLTAADIARLLHLRTENRLFFDEAEAYRRMIDAYEQLCRVIARRFPTAGAVLNGRYANSSMVFPIPPTVCREYVDLTFKEARI